MQRCEYATVSSTAPEVSIRDATRVATGDGAIMVQVLLLTGPEVVEVVRDSILIVFLVFAFFALVLLVIVTLLMYRRLAGLLEVATTTLERGDRVLEDIGAITESVKRSGAMPGIAGFALRGAMGTVGALLAGVFGRRGKRDNKSD